METAIAVALALGFASSGEPVPAFYGCEVEMIAGTNAYQFVDPTCPDTASADYVSLPVLNDEGEQVGTETVALNNK
jgi:hypothetical protein